MTTGRHISIRLAFPVGFPLLESYPTREEDILVYVPVEFLMVMIVPLSIGIVDLFVVASC